MSSPRTWSTSALLVGAVLATSLVGTGPATAAPVTAAGRDTHGAGGASASPTTRAARAAAVVGLPRRNYVIPQGSFFSFPNRSESDRQAIRRRVLHTIDSVWGGPHDPHTGVPYAGAGSIRLATWSFEDWAIARALVHARQRGVSVQVLAAAGKNKQSGPWRYLRKHLKARLHPTGHPELADRSSFARVCRGSCRGPGGTAHSKYFLFDDVGATRERGVVVNTSMNLTQFAYQNQWNQAQVWHSPTMYNDYLGVFRESRTTARGGYHVARIGNFAVDYFFPSRGLNAGNDPVMGMLSAVGCTGATSGGNSAGRTRIRIIQYALYGDRGVWIAKRLRQLWNAGCDIKIIYSFASRPVMAVLRSHRGPGVIPMRQSVIRNGAGDFEKYNHSKWMTVTGRWGGLSGAWMAFPGSANWADLSFTSDEQMQWVWGYQLTAPYLGTFDKTWRQRSSRKPHGGPTRAFDNARLPPELLRGGPTLGKGAYRFMDED